MALSATDRAMLARTIELAQSSIGLSDPNPRVGCVLHDASGRLAGEGFTQQAGGPHAEVVALRAAAANGHTLAGGTAWVSLEPCAHQGRTPPCADALIAAGLARVVVAVTDPYAEVAGRGLQRLRAAGIAVETAPVDDLSMQARELNIGFFSRVVRGRPWVRMKIAASLDGRTALADGRSQWITGPAARADGHAWRRRSGAILTGIGTVLADDPGLDVRLVPTRLQPLKVVVDSGLATPATARLLAGAGRTLVVAARAAQTSAQALRSAGAEVRWLADQNGRVDLRALVHQLAADGINELHVEAGPRLNAALLQSGLVDELLVYVAPKLLGPGRDLAALPPLQSLDEAQAWQFEAMDRVGDDLRLRLRRPGGNRFLSTAPQLTH